MKFFVALYIQILFIALYLLNPDLSLERLSNDFSLFSKDSIIRWIGLYENTIIYYLIVGNCFYLVILLLGYLNSRQKYLEKQLGMDQRMLPLKGLSPISILMPAYNEEASVIESVESMLKVNYPDFEVIVCNDGSKDQTMSRLIEHFNLKAQSIVTAFDLPHKPIKCVYKSEQFPHLTIIDKVNGGKADALNASINFSRHPLVCCVDCDSLLDSEGLTRIAIPFFERPDATIAVGGVIRLANDSKIEYGRVTQTAIPWRYLQMVQVVEYLRAFLVGRMGWDYMDCNTIISGAFGLFDKKTVIAVGGYDSSTIGEDFELLLRMHYYMLKHKKKYHVTFLPDPVCWTEAPEDIATLGNQRIRWQQGLGESLWKSRSLLFKPWSGRIGWIALPYLWIFEFLSAPLELFGYIILALGLYLDLVQIEVATLFLSVSILFGFTLTLGAVIVEELTFSRYSRNRDFFKLFLGAIFEQLGFRQVHLYWRTVGIYRWLRNRQSWGVMKRTGFKSNLK